MEIEFLLTSELKIAEAAKTCVNLHISQMKCFGTLFILLGICFKVFICSDNSQRLSHPSLP